MLQKLLLRTIGLMLGAGGLGLLAAHALFGHLDGIRIGFDVLFSSLPPPPEIGPRAPGEIEAIRDKVLAGGCIGLVCGLIAAASGRRRS
jgi:hypothetical protein